MFFSYGFVGIGLDRGINVAEAEKHGNYCWA